MKRNIFYLLLFLIIGTWACSDEPEFPDPGLDTTKSSIDTVRRDTIDKYLISMNISAPNGVEKIQILNGRNYQVIEEFSSEYRGKKDFTFEYTVDLTPITVDTTLQYIVKVIDQKMRSYNKGFTLRVNKFSTPDIQIVGGSDVMGLVSPVFELKALFETGLNTIDSYRVMLEGKVVDEKSFSDTLIHEYAYKHVINAVMEQNLEYVLRVELTDSEGTVGVREMKLRLVEMKRPIKITKSTEKGLSQEMELYYDEDHDRLDSILYAYYNSTTQTIRSYYRYEFEYSTEGLLIGWKRLSFDENRQYIETTSDVVYTYEPGTRRLKTIDFADGLPNFAITVNEWYDHGGVKSFRKGTSSLLIDNVHYTKDPNTDGVVYSQFWYSTVTADKFRQHCDNMTAILIPTYFPELPNIMMGSADPDWLDLFMYKYIFTRTIYTNRTPVEEFSRVSYSTDNMGRLIQLRRSQSDTYGRTTYNNYIFTYGD